MRYVEYPPPPTQARKIKLSIINLIALRSILQNFALVLLGIDLSLSLVKLLEHDIVRLVAELLDKIQVVAILATVEDELVRVTAFAVAELASHLLGSWLATVAMSRALLSSLDVELALELECLSVTWRPPLR